MNAHAYYSQATISPRQTSWVNDFLIIAMGSILLSLCASLAIRLPFSPIPLAIAPHLCLALGATLGSRRGTLAVLGYIAQGLIGLPVFAMGGSGLLTLLGPSGGYLIGYVAAAFVTGYLLETMQERSTYKTFFALATGNGIIYLCGATQLAFFIGFPSAILLGVFPFLLGDAWKLLVIHGAMHTLSRNKVQ